MVSTSWPVTILLLRGQKIDLCQEDNNLGCVPLEFPNKLQVIFRQGTIRTDGVSGLRDQMQIDLHLVALYAKMFSYGTEEILAKIVGIGVEAKIGRLALRGPSCWKDFSLPEYSAD